MSHKNHQHLLTTFLSTTTAALAFDLGQAGVSEDEYVIADAAAARADGSIVLGGRTSGDWYGEVNGIDMDFAAVALDEDGTELWRWQVCA